MFRTRALAFATLVLGSCLAAAAQAHVIPIPSSFRVGPARTDAADGLRVRFKDVSSGCGLALCQSATDTVTVQVTTMASVNFLLNQGCTFGPFSTGCGYFETRWDSYLNVNVAGYYLLSMQVDDCGSVAIGDSTVLSLDGGNWFVNVTSDTIQFAAPGAYPLLVYYADCQPCCRGFRLGGMGPPGSGMMAFTPGFDFNGDLGPCCTYGSNGPGVSLVPPALFYQSPPSASVQPRHGALTGTIVSCSASPNPNHGAVLLDVELARPDRVWVELIDAAGRRVAELASGEMRPAGVSRWPWSVDWLGPRRAASGVLYYRVRTADGSRAQGAITIIR